MSEIDFPASEYEHCEIEVPKVRKLKVEEEGGFLAAIKAGTITYPLRVDGYHTCSNLLYTERLK